MIAKIKKTSLPREKKHKKLEKKLGKKPKPAEKVPEIKKEPEEKPKKLKGISKRFNVEKPSKKPKIKEEVKSEESAEKPEEQPAVKRGRKPKANKFGVVQIKCLPHGFYEEELQGFFQQFGDVHRVRVARSLKTGKSTGVGYVEFRVPEVAEIAAQTMNNYLLMKNILKTTYIPPEKVTPKIMVNRVKVKLINGKEVVHSSATVRRRRAIEKHNARPTQQTIQKRQEKMTKKLEAKKKKLLEAGIDFDVDSVVKKRKAESPDATTSKKKVKKEEIKVKKEEKVVKEEKKKPEKSSEKTNDEAPKIKSPKAVLSKKVPKVKKLKEKPEKPKKNPIKKKKISIKLGPVKPKNMNSSPLKDSKKGLKIKVGQKVASKVAKKNKKNV